ncbi:MAG: magnesium transporter [Thermoanaerobaculia bacterium]|nr:magnesium transporter [Thermoanaerobaculia bacterium]
MTSPTPHEPPRRQLLADTLRKFQERGAEVNISRLLGRIRPEDVALLLVDLESDQRRQVFDILSADFPEAAGDVLTEMAPAQRLELLENLPPERTAKLLERLPVDDAVFVLESLPGDLHDRLLELVDLSGRSEMQTHLAYREGSAGRIMDPDFFALAEGETVQAAIAAIQQKRDLEMIFYLYVVDRDSHLVGVTSLRQLLLSRPVQTLGEIMQKSVIKLHVDTDQEEVAAQAARYNLLAVPVVDDQNRLVGIVTVDDIIDVVKEEATEDLFKLAGSSDSELLYEERSLRVAGLRLPSLLVSIVGLLAVGFLLQYFQLQFQDALFLLAFVPVIMGLGGSIGSQTSTVAVRGLATGRLEAGEGRFGAFVVRQLRVAVLLGLACGLLVGVAALVFWQNPIFGLVVGLALFLAILLASATGALIPLALERLGFDPAVASGPMLSTANDITGILIYFGLAAAFLRHLAH